MVCVSSAERSDVAAIADLMEEIDRFYGVVDVEPRDVRVRRITDALFAHAPAAHALLAWDGNRLVGLAACSFLWPGAGTTRSLYLKELYVAETARRRGVGRMLLQRVLEIAAEHQCSRVEWTTDDVNTDAQRFYEKLGMKRHPSKIFYRTEGEELARTRMSPPTTGP